MSAADAKKTPQEKWPGLNLLGEILNNLKNEFNLKNTKPNEVVRRKP